MWRGWRGESILEFQAEVNGVHSVTLSDVLLTNFETERWYHLAVVRSGSEWISFVDGEIVGRLHDSDAMPDIAGSLVIRMQFPYNAFYYNGYLDEIRISKTARWTSEFTPPTSGYEVAPERVVPEPATLSLLGLGLLGLVFKRKKIK